MGIDILIPALGRPGDIPPLMESLADSPHRVVFICSPLDMDQIQACRRTNKEVWIAEWEPGKGDYARKINWAYERTDDEWVFQGATDLKFYPGWDRVALRVAERTGMRVIGTNDLHNPQVRRKMQSTHTLFARSYIEEYGGLDNTGKVISEAYDHQYIDLEACELARRRGEWVFARQSIVEHLHPHWGLAEDGETYAKAMRATAEDRRLYLRRMGNNRRPKAMERAARRRART